MVNDLAQVVAAGDFVFDLAEDLPNLVFEGVGATGFLGETVQVGEEFQVDEVAPVNARLWSIWSFWPLGAAQLSQR